MMLDVRRHSLGGSLVSRLLAFCHCSRIVRGAGSASAWRPSAVPDLTMWRPWAGSLLFRGPYPPLKCYNLHALTFVIITKYIYIYIYTW